MSAVSNTGPLVALVKADSLSLLRLLFTEVQIPPAVYHGLIAKSGREAVRLQAAFQDFVRVTVLPAIPPGVQSGTANLGDGEQQAIALAASTHMLLVIDDRAGRRAARRLQVKVIGTVGVLLEAKKTGLITAVRPLLTAMRAGGYYLSDRLVEDAAKLAGE